MESFWTGKNVLVTGCTGFKGSWLSLILVHLGAKVSGYALEPDSSLSLFKLLKLEKEIDVTYDDIRHSDNVKKQVTSQNPDFVFHLAAQPLVLKSYKEPLETWSTNLTGTLNLLHSFENPKKKCTIIVVTTDKVYHNSENGVSLSEKDRLGGVDPYSASKASVELLVSSWQRSFFEKNQFISAATARAGNVIGGGDWATDRIFPDLIKSYLARKTFILRNPKSTRPWQHVLEPLSGYLLLAQAIHENYKLLPSYNFAPHQSDNISSLALTKKVSQLIDFQWDIELQTERFEETHTLNLCNKNARLDLGYSPRWNLDKAILETVNWYVNVLQNNEDAINETLKQINEFKLL